MVTVFVRAGVLASAQTRKQRWLRVQGTLQGTILPQQGDWFRVEVPYPNPILERTYRPCRFLITRREICWGADGEYVEVTAGTFFPDLIHLAVVHEWQVISGIQELSPDQQNLVECRQGTCNQKGHAHGR